MAVSRKLLIAYFSWGGNTRTIAEYIHQVAGCELFEIKTVKAYPREYDSTTKTAKQEQTVNARPALASKIDDSTSFDVIFLGYPNWWGTLPMALFTFLESSNLTGKTIIPFCTHGGSGLGRSVADIRKLSPKSTVGEGLAIGTGKVRSAQNDVTIWLRKLGIVK
jgi:flavodoxin